MIKLINVAPAARVVIAAMICVAAGSANAQHRFCVQSSAADRFAEGRLPGPDPDQSPKPDCVPTNHAWMPLDPTPTSHTAQAAGNQCGLPEPFPG